MSAFDGEPGTRRGLQVSAGTRRVRPDLKEGQREKEGRRRETEDGHETLIEGDNSRPEEVRGGRRKGALHKPTSSA